MQKWFFASIYYPLNFCKLTKVIRTSLSNLSTFLALDIGLSFGKFVRNTLLLKLWLNVSHIKIDPDYSRPTEPKPTKPTKSIPTSRLYIYKIGLFYYIHPIRLRKKPQLELWLSKMNYDHHFVKNSDRSWVCVYHVDLSSFR